MKEKMERSEAKEITSAQLPMEETITEGGVVNLNPINNTDSEVNEATEQSDLNEK